MAQPPVLDGIADLMISPDNPYSTSEAGGNLSQYAYQPLKYSDSIRLIELQPAIISSLPSQRATLECHLVEARLSVQVDFEAMSYAWGEPNFSACLSLPNGIINITANLSAALHAFRHNTKSRYLWADAVCINQQDIVEKASQIILMAQIYGQARSVLVWLGPGDERTGHVFSLFKHLCSVATTYGVKSSHTESEDPTDDLWEGLDPTIEEKARLNSIAKDFDFHSMDAFYSLPWFKRLWVVQEIVLARAIQIRCGDYDMSWNAFITAARVQYRSVRRSTLLNLRLPIGFAYCVRIDQTRIKWKSQKPRQLIDHIRFLRSNMCSNDLDRIYALLSLRGPADPVIEPDYSISVDELFVGVTIGMMKRPFDVFILYYAGIAHRTGGNNRGSENTVYDFQTPNPDQLCVRIPSWVPDWRIRTVSRSFSLGSELNTYSAASAVPLEQFTFHQPDASNSQRILVKVKALGIDTVKVGQNLGHARKMNLEQFREMILLIKGFYDQHQHEVTQYPPGQDILTRFVQTITADFNEVVAQEWIRDIKTTKEHVDLWRQYESTPVLEQSLTPAAYFDSSTSALGGGNVRTMSELYTFRVAIRTVVQDRQLVVTNNGRVGLLPAIAQPGDWIVVLAGTRVPFVIRPTGNLNHGQETWYIIGDCYLNGIMYGELFAGHKVDRYATNWRWIYLA